MHRAHDYVAVEAVFAVFTDAAWVVREENSLDLVESCHVVVITGGILHEC